MFALSFLILICSSALSLFSIRSLRKSDLWVNHTYLVLQKLDSIATTLKDAETGYRGYLLTGNTVFLEPYTGSSNRFYGALGEAERLTRDNPAQQKSLPMLRALVDRKYQLAEIYIRKTQLKRKVTPAELLQAKQTMDAIRSLIEVMKRREIDLLAQRTTESKSYALYTPFLILAAGLIGIGLTIGYYVKIKKNLAQHEVLSLDLEKVEQQRELEISSIASMAAKVASGDYSARIDVSPDSSTSENTSEKQRAESD